MKLSLSRYTLILIVFLVPPKQAAFASPANAEAGNTGHHFICNTGYTLQKCQADIAVLGKALAKYPLTELGEWTWILVRSEDWKSIVVPRGMSSGTPAFTYYEKHETFIEEALVTQVSGRSAELLKEWGMSREDLLDSALAHELGHALCDEWEEGKANQVARMLQENKPFTCEFRRAKSTRSELKTRSPRR